jgi:integrase
MSYLHKRGAVYYTRLVVPERLRPIIGKSDLGRSLGVKDRKAALQLVGPWLTEAQAVLADAEQQLIGREIEQQDARREARRHLKAYWDRQLSYSTEELSPRYGALRDVLREREERRAFRSALVAPTSPEARAAVSDGIMLEPALVDLWAAERKVSPKGIDTHRAVARWFDERVGRKPVDQITRKDVLAFKDSLIAEHTAANTNMKLSRLQTLLQWAEANDYREGNPAKGVRVLDTEAAKNKRKPFDLRSLNLIFASPVYATGERPTKGRGEAAYWLPLLALFTGARLEELGQLRPIDVQLEHYPDENGQDQTGWFIHIREDVKAGLKLKNAASERLVPVHPELERLGFVQFAEAAKAAKQNRLFPLLKPNIYGRLTAKWGEWWSTYRRGVCGITDKRLVFHSFRHTFKHHASHVGMIEGVQRAIMGHSPGDVADDYRGGYTLFQLAEGMKLYKVPGLKLPA